MIGYLEFKDKQEAVDYINMINIKLDLKKPSMFSNIISNLKNESVIIWIDEHLKEEDLPKLDSGALKPVYSAQWAIDNEYIKEELYDDK